VDMPVIIQDGPQGCLIAQICGELDISTAPDLREQLLAILNRQTTSRLILDLSKLEFIDSSGVAVLINTERRARLLGGSIALVAPQRPVSRVLQICGVDRCLPIFNDVTAAVGRPQSEVVRPLKPGLTREAGDSDCALT
jgi:anti-sigma B factor antagonist